MAKQSPRSRTKAFKKSGISSAIAAHGRGKGLYNIWIFRSAKTDKDLRVRADGHFLECYLLEADPTCLTYEIEKPAHTWKDGEKLETIFDVEVIRTDRRVQAVEVKTHDRRGEAASESDQDQERRQRAIADAQGLEYVRVHRQDILASQTLLASVKMGVAAINAARHHSLHSLSVEMSTLFARRRTWSAGDLLDQFEHSSRGLAIACLFKSVFAGAIKTDLPENPFCRQTRLEWAGESGSHERPPSSVSTHRWSDSSVDSELPSRADKPTRRRLALRGMPLEWTDLSTWPKLNEASLPEDEAKKFSRIRAAVTAYLDGSNATAVAKETGVSRSELYRAVERALSLHADGAIWGWRALKPNVRVKQYERTTPSPRSATEFSDADSGFAGAFTQVLDSHVVIRDGLKDLALKTGGGAHESRINAKDFHSEFLRLCKSVGIGPTQYPFNTADQGARSCRRHLDELRASDFETGAKILGGIPALVRSRVGNGESSLVTAVTLPFEAVMQDGHTIDCLGSVTFPHPSGPRRVPMSRCRIEVVVEVRSRAVLGYVLIFKRGTNSEDALGAVVSALSKWQPLPRPSPDFPVQYPQGGGLPSGLIPELEGAAWSTMLIDNASVYTSEAMVGRLRARVGCAVNFGPVGDFTRRYLIEGVYSVLAKRGFQRLPSTTGSGPKDTRRQNAEEKSFDLPFDELAYLIDVAIATYNATELKSLAGRSPISYLQELYSGPKSPLIPRPIPPLAHSQADLDVFVKEITVRGNQKEGRRPYVEFHDVHYTNHNIRNSAGLINKVVCAHIKRSDLRQFEVFSVTGESLGFVKADRGWNRVKHSLEQRIVINELIRDRRLRRSSEDEDWVQAYLRLLSKRAADSGSGKSAPKVSPDAASAAHVAHTANLPIPPIDIDAPEESNPLRPMTLPELTMPATTKAKRKAFF